MSTMMPLPDRSAGVSGLLEAATRLFRVTLFKLLPEAMVALLITQLPGLYARARGLTVTVTQMPQDPVFWVCYIASDVLLLLLVGTILLRQGALLRGGSSNLPAELRGAAQRLLVAFVASFVATCVLSVCASMSLAPLLVAGGGLLVWLGALPGIAIGTYLFVCFFILMCVVMFEPVGPWQALRVCVQRVRPLWGRFLAVVVIGLLVMAVCVLTAGVVLGVVLGVLGNTASPQVQALQSALALAILAVCMCWMLALARVLYSAASSSA